MALIVYTSRALRDLERIVDFVAAHDAALAAVVVEAIEEAVSVLERHPLIGRPAQQGLRELLISRGRTGFAALYRYQERAELVMVLAVHHQREAGYEPSVVPSVE